MLGFIPFLSWWGILANIEHRKKGSDVMFASIFFNLDSASFRFACFHRLIIKWPNNHKQQRYNKQIILTKEWTDQYD